MRIQLSNHFTYYAFKYLFSGFAIMLLPRVGGVDGIWISIVVAELMTTLVVVFFLVSKRLKYC